VFEPSFPFIVNSSFAFNSVFGTVSAGAHRVPDAGSVTYVAVKGHFDTDTRRRK
jgi:hypothetical protein